MDESRLSIHPSINLIYKARPNHPRTNIFQTHHSLISPHPPPQQAFAPASTFGVRTLASTTELEACRVNAKKEKRQRNRENMRKFQKRGKTSRKKMMRKVASGEMRQLENEFIVKCFTSITIDVEPKEEQKRGGRY